MAQSKTNNDEAPAAANDPSQLWRELVARHVASLRFGVVQIVVHDSRVVQIERTEKVRLDRRED